MWDETHTGQTTSFQDQQQSSSSMAAPSQEKKIAYFGTQQEVNQGNEVRVSHWVNWCHVARKVSCEFEWRKKASSYVTKLETSSHQPSNIQKATPRIYLSLFSSPSRCLPTIVSKIRFPVGRAPGLSQLWITVNLIYACMQVLYSSSQSSRIIWWLVLARWHPNWEKSPGRRIVLLLLLSMGKTISYHCFKSCLFYSSNVVQIKR